MRLWFLSHRWPAKAQESLRLCTVSLKPLLFAHMKYESRQRFWPKIRDGCACTFEEWVYGERGCTIICSCPKIRTVWFYHAVTCQKECRWNCKQCRLQEQSDLCTLFSQTWLSEHLGSLHHRPKETSSRFQSIWIFSASSSMAFCPQAIG